MCVSKTWLVSNLDTVWLVVTDVNLIAAIAGGDTVGKLHSFHDAELVQNGPGLLTEDDHSLNFALYDNDVAESINGHSTRILQYVRAELSYESTIPCKYLNLQTYSTPDLTKGYRLTKHVCLASTLMTETWTVHSEKETNNYILYFFWKKTHFHNIQYYVVQPERFLVTDLHQSLIFCNQQHVNSWTPLNNAIYYLTENITYCNKKL